jgi:hypothetical protein
MSRLDRIGVAYWLQEVATHAVDIARAIHGFVKTFVQSVTTERAGLVQIKILLPLTRSDGKQPFYELQLSTGAYSLKHVAPRIDFLCDYFGDGSIGQDFNAFHFGADQVLE